MNLISIAEYAAAHGISAATMRQRILRGIHPEAVKIGSQWAIPKDAPFVDHRSEKRSKRVRETKPNE